MIAGYAHPNRCRSKTMIASIVNTVRNGVPALLEELDQLGRALRRRRRYGILAHFGPHASNRPTEAINGRFEALRRSALGFRNMAHYRIRSLLHCGNLAQPIDAL